MTDKKVLIEELILKNPNLSGSEIYGKIKGTPLGIRKKTFFEILRDTRKLPEPSLAKKEASIPIKHRTTIQKTKIAKREKVKVEKEAKAEAKKEAKIEAKKEAKAKAKKEVKDKPTKIPYEQTKFGKIANDLEKGHKISEKNAIIRARALLKIPRKDYHKLNKLDVQILLTHTP